MFTFVILAGSLGVGQVDAPPGAAIGSVPLGQVNLPLYEATRNTGRPPEQWQFRYTPAFVPEVGEKGRIVATNPMRLPNGKYEIAVDLLMGNRDLDELAYEEVKKLKRDKADQILKGSVFVWPVKWVKVTIPAGVQEKFPTLKLARSTWNTDASKPLTVRLWLDSAEEAKNLAANIGALALDIEYALEAASTQRNAIEVTSADIKQSKLRAALNGLGTNEVFVRRWDLLILSESVRSVLSYRGEIENPKRFDETLASKLIAKAEGKALLVTKPFDKVKWEATYNGDDLKPTVLTKMLNKAFEYDASTKHFKLK